MTVDNRKISGQVKVTKRREKKGVHGFFFGLIKKKIKKEEASVFFKQRSLIYSSSKSLPADCMSDIR